MSALLSNLLLGRRARPLWIALFTVLMLVVGGLALSPLPPTSLDTGWDKVNHALAFAALAFSGHWSLRTPRARWLLLPLALLAYGGAIELAQLCVPSRSGEWADLLADAVGLSVGLLLAGAMFTALRSPSIKGTRQNR